jgi:hypothetical protein
MVSVRKPVALVESQPRFLRGRDLFCLSSQLDLFRNTERVVDLDA